MIWKQDETSKNTLKWNLKSSRTQQFKTWTSLSNVLLKEKVMNKSFRKGSKRLNERKLQIQKCKVQEVKASNASSGDKDCSRIVSDKGNDQGLENQSKTSGDKSNRLRNECNDKSTFGDDTDIKPSYDMKPIVKIEQNAKDERATLANSIVNLKLDIDEMIPKQFKKHIIDSRIERMQIYSCRY
nr:hypothetical protein [Tanacetum cinerariifolium]